MEKTFFLKRWSWWWWLYADDFIGDTDSWNDYFSGLSVEDYSEAEIASAFIYPKFLSKRKRIRKIISYVDRDGDDDDFMTQTLWKLEEYKITGIQSMKEIMKVI